MPRAAIVTFLLSLAVGSASAQTDYYNTDAGRPITVEDAYPVERHAFELQLAPLRLWRSAGTYTWALEPELAYGLLPRTQLEVGLPLVYADPREGPRSTGVAGLDVGVLHNLNVETRTLPAFGVAAELLAPVGSLAPDRAYLSLKGIATRTWSLARLHLNGAYTLGDSPGEESAGHDLARWTAGAAVDHAFPLQSVLVTAELVAEGPMVDDATTEWRTGAGLRWQRTPRLALDVGGGVRLNGGERPWYLTFGGAYAFAFRSLIPVR